MAPSGLIDHHHRGHGYGAAALALVREHLRTREDARVLITSVTQGPAMPIGFYLRHGFRDTGRVHLGEVVLELELPAR